MNAKRITKFVKTIVWTYIFLSGIVFGQDKNNNTKEISKILQASLDSLTAAQIVPGITLSVLYKDSSTISLASGLEDIEDHIILKPDGVMFSGSVGKTYVAAVVLKLYEDGKIDLKAKSVDYLRYEE